MSRTRNAPPAEHPVVNLGLRKEFIAVRVEDPDARAQVLAGFIKNNNTKLKPLINKGLVESAGLLLLLPRKFDAMGDAFRVGADAAGILGFKRRSTHFSIMAIHAAQAQRCGLGSCLVSTLKEFAKEITVESPPCLGKPTVQFYMANEFNPSQELLRQPRLYNGEEERVRGSEDVRMTWSQRLPFNIELARQVVAKFVLTVRLPEPRSAPPPPPPPPRALTRAPPAAFKRRPSKIPHAGDGLFATRAIRATQPGDPIDSNVHRPFVRGGISSSELIYVKTEYEASVLHKKDTNDIHNYDISADVIHRIGEENTSENFAPVPLVCVDGVLCRVHNKNVPGQPFESAKVGYIMNGECIDHIDFSHEGWFLNEQRKEQGYMRDLGTWVSSFTSKKRPGDAVVEMYANDHMLGRPHDPCVPHNMTFVPVLTRQKDGRYAASNLVPILLHDVEAGDEIFVDYKFSTHDRHEALRMTNIVSGFLPCFCGGKCNPCKSPTPRELYCSYLTRAQCASLRASVLNRFQSEDTRDESIGLGVEYDEQGIGVRFKQWVAPVVTFRSAGASMIFRFLHEEKGTGKPPSGRGSDIKDPLPATSKAGKLCAECVRLTIQDVNHVLNILDAGVVSAGGGVEVDLDSIVPARIDSALEFIANKSIKREKPAAKKRAGKEPILPPPKKPRQVSQYKVPRRPPRQRNEPPPQRELASFYALGYASLVFMTDACDCGFASKFSAYWNTPAIVIAFFRRCARLSTVAQVEHILHMFGGADGTSVNLESADRALIVSAMKWIDTEVPPLPHNPYVPRGCRGRGMPVEEPAPPPEPPPSDEPAPPPEPLDLDDALDMYTPTPKKSPRASGARADGDAHVEPMLGCHVDEADRGDVIDDDAPVEMRDEVTLTQPSTSLVATSHAFYHEGVLILPKRDASMAPRCEA